MFSFLFISIFVLILFGNFYFSKSNQLKIAIDFNNLNKVKVLIKQGIDVNQPYFCFSFSEPFRYPLIDSLYGSDFSIAQELIAAGANLEVANKDGWTPLMVSCISGNINKVKLLLDNGADINSKAGNTQSTALIKAIQLDKDNIVKYLIEQGAEINFSDTISYTPLHWACTNGKLNFEIIKCLVEHGADINAKTCYGKTPLDIAKDRNDIHLIKYLEDYQAGYISNESTSVDTDEYLDNDNRESTNKSTIDKNYDEFVDSTADDDSEYATEAPVDAITAAEYNQRDSRGRTPLINACCWEGWYSVKDFLKNPTDTFIFDNENNRLEIVKFLVEHGSDINATDNDGYSALMYASKQNYINIVTWLVYYGADTTIQDKYGNTAASITFSQEIKKILNSSPINK